MITLLAEKEYLTPPDNEAMPVTKCFFCCETIYSGDEFYRLDGLNCCEDCLDRYYKVIAEPIYWEAEEADLECHEIEGRNFEKRKNIGKIESA